MDENNILWDTLPETLTNENNNIIEKIFSEDNIEFKKICEDLERNKNENNN